MRRCSVCPAGRVTRRHGDSAASPKAKTKELLAPALLVHEWRVEHVLTRVGVHPTRPLRQPHLVHMVGDVEHPARVKADRIADQREAVGPSRSDLSRLSSTDKLYLGKRVTWPLGPR